MKLSNIALSLIFSTHIVFAQQPRVLELSDQEHGVNVNYLDNKGHKHDIFLVKTDLDENEYPHIAYFENGLVILQRFHPANIGHQYKQEAFLPYKDDSIILFEAVSSEETKDSLFQHDDINIFKCCFSANDATEYSDPRLIQQFNQLTNYKEILKKDPSKITIYDAIILSQNVENDVLKINDFAYELYKKNQFLFSGIILKSITSKFPDRTVSLLNYADAIWMHYYYSPSNQKKSIYFYQKYKSVMIKNKKENLIPSYIEQRIQFIENLFVNFEK